jgi:signal transduction histidine kinase
VTKPVTQLAEAARTVAGGNVDVELEVFATDEIGDLSRSFNQMTASLRTARDEIMTQQRKLQEANAELGGKNEDLEEAMRLLQKTQQQLVMREKMASLGNLVAGVAHEINNPIGAVMSAADTSSRSIDVVCKALDDGANADEIRKEAQFQKALQILRDNTRITLTASARIAEIVKSLKNFARLDEAEFQDADVHDGLDSTLTLLHHRMKNRITINRNYGKLPKIPCFPNQINQVFMNVLSNAEQAIVDQGTITITTRLEKDNAIIEVADNGRGIEPEKVGRIFDPGFTTKGVGVGTGLGLSITYNIIQRHHGDIRVESELGKGTKVTIVLPLVQAEAAEA